MSKLYTKEEFRSRIIDILSYLRNVTENPEKAVVYFSDKFADIFIDILTHYYSGIDKKFGVVVLVNNTVQFFANEEQYLAYNKDPFTNQNLLLGKVTIPTNTTIVEGGGSSGLTEEQLHEYLTEVLGTYATKDYVTEELSKLPSGGGGITETDLETYLATNGYATQEWVDTNRWIKPITTVTANKTLTEEDCMVVITASTRITLTLPSLVTKGRSYEIFGRNSAGMILKSGRTIYRANGSNSTSHTISAGYFHAMVTYDGSYWLLSITENS